jgi:hypothetical protein
VLPAEQLALPEPFNGGVVHKVVAPVVKVTVPVGTPVPLVGVTVAE